MLNVAARPADTVASASSYLARLSEVLALVPEAELRIAVETLLEARAAGRRVYLIGNGGSAATAGHIACDLAKGARVPGKAPLRTFALSDNTALMTAWANDSAYEQTFAEQVAGVAEAGDVVIALSASGNSPNIVAGLRAAAARGARTIGLLGFDGGAARDLVDISIHIPCNDYGLVEDTHSAIGHALTLAIRTALSEQTA
jgi:D-sedoheptulose 7-phosphate isomerase